MYTKSGFECNAKDKGTVWRYYEKAEQMGEEKDQGKVNKKQEKNK